MAEQITELKYREALKIGNKAEGAVKCTFATLYADKDGKQPLFSLQRDDASKKWMSAETQNTLIEMEFTWQQEHNGADLGREAMIQQLGQGVYFLNDHLDDQSKYGGANGYVWGEIPIVEADGLYDGRCVPMHILDSARTVIKEAFEKAYKKWTKYSVYKVWHRDEVVSGGVRIPKGTVSKDPIVVSYNPINTVNLKKTAAVWRPTYPKGTFETWIKSASIDDRIKADKVCWHYEISTEYVTHEKYNKLLDILDNNGTVYAKPDAFVWAATDIKALTVDKNGKEMTLENYVIDSFNDLERAKKLLILAGGAALI